MRVRVNYLAQVKRAAGVAEEAADLAPEGSLRDLLAVLADRHGADFRRLVLDPQGRVQPTLLFFVGDEQLRPECDRPLRDGEVVTILAPMAGG